MRIELHMLQNFAPSNLNRDDTGSPKDCEFGGFRRARISSQCLKRALRQHFTQARLLPEAHLAVRTARLIESLADQLATKGKEREQGIEVARAALASAGFAAGAGSNRTEYLLFLGRAEIQRLAEICATHWDDLRKAAPGKKAASKKEDKGASKPFKEAVLAVLDGGKAADLALFGRMLADLPERAVDAACQVAHAISTHRTTVEFDYFTAVDDLQPPEETGAPMIGTVEFNSACFYRYLNVDLDQLARNLDGDSGLVDRAVEAMVRAAVEAIPSGKQNSMAAQNPPSFVMAVVRQRGLWSLVNAFVKPVRASESKSLVAASIEALDDHWGRLTSAYGEEDIVEASVLSIEPDAELRHLKRAALVPNLAALLDRVRKATQTGAPAARG